MAPTPVYELEYTHGCNGHQILELLQEELGSVMLGHWKFGLSSSVLDEFHWDLMDGVLDGIYLIETVTVPANRTTPTVSSYSLESGMDYKLVARGTASAGDGITFDARYSFRSGSSTIWTDSVSTYESYGVGLLDLFLDGSTPWGDYSSIHEYEYYMVGSGLQISLLINDVYYPNNTGNLYVDIYADL